MFRTRMRRAGLLAGSVLVAVSVLTLVFIGVGPHSGRYRTATVLSGSMGRTAPAGSVVVVTPMPVSEVRAGDVITYQIPVEDRRVVTHRVVEVVEAGDHPVVRTRGDANPAPDPWLARLEGSTAWKARLAVPGLGRVVQTLRQPRLQTLLVRIAPVLLALVWLIDIWTPPGRRRSGRGAVTRPVVLR